MVSFSVCRVSIPLIQSSRERLPGRCKRYLGEVSVNIPVSFVVDVGEEGISVAPRPGGEEIFSRFFALPRFIEIGQLESHRKWGIRMQPYAQQPRNSPRVHTEDRSLSSPRAYATSDVLHAKKKMRFPPRIAVIPLGVGRKIVGTLEETQEWRKFLLVMNGGLAWGCVSWTR